MGPEPDERELREGRRGTPLHVAAWMGDADKVAELTRAGGAAALEARSKNGSTPLHWVSGRARALCAARACAHCSPIAALTAGRVPG